MKLRAVHLFVLARNLTPYLERRRKQLMDSHIIGSLKNIFKDIVDEICELLFQNIDLSVVVYSGFRSQFNDAVFSWTFITKLSTVNLRKLKCPKSPEYVKIKKR